MKRMTLMASVAVLLTMWLTTGIGSGQTGGAYDLSWTALSAGEQTSSAGAYELIGAIGDPDGATLSGASYTLLGGFLAAAGLNSGSPACNGDCDGSGGVTVNELITLVNIDLGTADASTCPNGIPSGTHVDITLIVKAVGYALTNCP